MKQRYTVVQIVLELLGGLLFIGIVALACLYWYSLPEYYPEHYNAQGEIDRWSARWEIFIFPAVGAVLYGLLTLLACYAARWNFSTAIKENAAVWIRVRTMLCVLKLELAGALFFITLSTVMKRPLPGWFLMIFLMLLGGTLADFLIHTRRLNKRSV